MIIMKSQYALNIYDQNAKDFTVHLADTYKIIKRVQQYVYSQCVPSCMYH